MIAGGLLKDVESCPLEEKQPQHGVLGEGDYLGLSAREMVESPEQTALDFGSSQGDKTGYSSHNQGGGG